MGNEKKCDCGCGCTETLSYGKTLSKLRAIVGKENVDLPNKVKNDDVKELVGDLFAEENFHNREEFKKQLRCLLKKHVQMKDEVEAKRQELLKIAAEKEKEFSKACESLFQKIEDIDATTERYSESLCCGLKSQTTESDCTPASKD
jgi:hypothetical protein